VTALIQKESSRRVKTFTIGFNSREYDEASYARGIANHLGTEHIEYYCSNSDMLDIVDRLPAAI